MALTAAERMARLRARQRTSGLATLSLVVPADDVYGFMRLATRRRIKHVQGQRTRPSTVRLSLPRKVAAGTSISPTDILAFRMLLETTAVALCVRRMNARTAGCLQAQLARESALDAESDSAEFQRFHQLLGKLSGDEPLQLLLRIALQLTDDRSAFRRSRVAERVRVVGAIRRMHTGIVEAMIDRNEALAVRRVRRYLSGLREWLE